jgi:hypothetical protein
MGEIKPALAHDHQRHGHAHGSCCCSGRV